MRNHVIWTLALAMGVVGVVGTAFLAPKPVHAQVGMAPVQQDVPMKASDIRPLLPGSLVPDVMVTDIDGKSVRLLEAASKKPTVLIFYRGGWCPFCNAQMGQLQKIEPELAQMGCQILAISADRPEELKKSLDKHHLTYTLLSDNGMAASRAFGVAFRVDDATLDKYKGFGVDLEAAAGAKHHMLPVPSVFVLSTTGVVQFSYSNPNYKVRLAPEVLVAAAKADLPVATR